ncbi:transmembrane 9 superfamily member 7-like [Rhodamnia argentea]|uniref:Transmembrane 9 superfamily member n=1 Tax=Rhodamnia argentea TaxID=178133 RepID=A0A8B8P931_9MYRT|nr:transmembrane 9 superfamily member 7-like [Rhodamnia argentea]
MVLGDVFMPFCTHTAAGVQFIGMIVITVIVAVARRNFNFQSCILSCLLISKRLVSIMTLARPVMGLLAGYASASINSVVYFFVHLEIAESLLTLLYFGYMLIALYAIFVLSGAIDFFSSFCAISYLAMLVSHAPLVGIWFPLVFAGSHLASKDSSQGDSALTDEVAFEFRSNPQQIWHKRPVFSILFAGILPFAIIADQLHLGWMLLGRMNFTLPQIPASSSMQNF